ncbi:hypothetical protein AVEN_76211-1 [Araneus ventricosus]|uniref:Uncharacterized protein n=1 Tax=Araneus ventricosus TaxID=182803 RepID=A0A4Y2KJI5_ARAVE|nr:hypothetical protein AVEN_76211-1 [Araneus ventricosus]
MGRKINTTLPVAKTQLQPYTVNKKVLEAKVERRMEVQKTNYDKHHVQSGKRVYRRNRKHLIPSPEFHPEPEPEDDLYFTGYQHSPADAVSGCSLLISSPQSPKTYSEKASSSTESSPDPYVTRSGRTVRPPGKLDL